MTKDDILVMERRLVHNEAKVNQLHEDIQDIKKTLRWLAKLIFTLNSTILGVVTKGFGMLG